MTKQQMFWLGMLTGVALMTIASILDSVWR